MKSQTSKDSAKIEYNFVFLSSKLNFITNTTTVQQHINQFSLTLLHLILFSFCCIAWMAQHYLHIIILLFNKIFFRVFRFFLFYCTKAVFHIFKYFPTVLQFYAIKKGLRLLRMFVLMPEGLFLSNTVCRKFS